MTAVQVLQTALLFLLVLSPLWMGAFCEEDADRRACEALHRELPPYEGPYL